MRDVTVLYFTADPRLARPNGEPLEFDQEFRQITQRVKKATYGGNLRFEVQSAAQADDLIDLLEDTDARIVHFSGHGGERGLRLVGRGGRRAHFVDAAALGRLFRNCNGSVQLAVLSACSSEAEARAIAKVVGCAIGTLNPITDKAAIEFNSRFYESIANGHSVGFAHEKACTALQMHGIDESEYPRIFVRDSRVNPVDLVFFKSIRLVPIRIAAAVAACAVTAAAVIHEPPVLPELTVSDKACGTVAGPAGTRTAMDSQGAAATTTPANPAGPAERVAIAKAFYAARNYTAAAEAFSEAAANGNGEAMGCLGYMYLAGRGVDSQAVTGVEFLRKGAREERDAHAMYALALAYLNGDGVNQSDSRAEEWLQKAVQEKGYPEAMRALGGMYQARMNDSSSQLALTWFQRAVNAGSVDARVDLGLMYESGQGVRRDAGAAFRWYRSAALAESPRGMLALGRCYHNAIGVARNYRMALDWYRRAVNAGSADAMASIGVLYENGFGVRKSYAKAIRWYRRAMKAGSDVGAVNLGRLGRD